MSQLVSSNVVDTEVLAVIVSGKYSQRRLVFASLPAINLLLDAGYEVCTQISHSSVAPVVSINPV